MIRYVPEFILHNYERKIFAGELEGYIFWLGQQGQLADSRLRDQLRKSGLEAQQSLLGRNIELVFDAIKDNGGFICQIEGGSCYAIFPGVPAANVSFAAQQISDLISSRAETSPLSELVRRYGLHVGYGKLRWRIIPNQLQAEYVFYGQALADTRDCCGAGEFLCVNSAARARLGRRATAHSLTPPTSPPPAIRVGYSVRPQTGASFTNKLFHYYELPAELRRSVCCWMDLGPCDNGEASRDAQTLELLAATHGAFIASFTCSGGSLRALILFDLPPNQGAKLQRSCKFALDALKNIPSARAGIASGYLFTGFFQTSGGKTGAVMGEAVDHAAQLAARARPGEALTDSRLRGQLQGQFQFVPAACSAPLRRGKPVRCYRLAGPYSFPPQGGRDLFVGRAAQLKRLGGYISAALASGDGSVLMLWGAPGIGKSRLADEVVAAVPAFACRKIFVSCSGEGEKPLGAVGQIVRGILSLPETENVAEAEAAFQSAWAAFTPDNPALREQEPFIRALAGQAGSGTAWQELPPEARPQRFQTAWLALLQELLSRQSLLLRIDDAHWLDRQSRELFHLLDRGGYRRIVVLGTVRPQADGSRRAYRLDTFSGHNLKLGSLPAADVKALCRDQLGILRLPAATFQLIDRAARGNPFHVEQLLAYLAENGLIDSRGELAPAALLEELEIDQIILRRVARLSAKVRLCVRNASVLGFRFNIRVLAQMLRGDLAKELRDGAGNRLWKDADDLFYIFSHALIQSSVYDSLLGPELRELHLAAAQAMEIVYVNQIPEHAEEIAGHFVKAEQPRKAAHYYQIAGDRYWELMLLPRAEACLSAALEQARAGFGEDSPEHAKRQFWLALLYHFLQRFDAAEALYNRVIAAKTSQLGPRNPGLSPYLNNLGRFYKDRGRYAEAEKLLRRSLRIEEKIGPGSSNVADRINNIGHLYSLRGDYDRAAAQFRAALEVMDGTYEPDHWFTAVCASNLAGALLSLDRPEEAEPLILRSIEISSQAWGEDHLRTATHYSILARLRQRQRRLDEAESLLSRVFGIYVRAFGESHPHTQKVADALRELRS